MQLYLIVGFCSFFAGFLFFVVYLIFNSIMIKKRVKYAFNSIGQISKVFEYFSRYPNTMKSVEMLLTNIAGLKGVYKVFLIQYKLNKLIDVIENREISESSFGEELKKLSQYTEDEYLEIDRRSPIFGLLKTGKSVHNEMKCRIYTVRLTIVNSWYFLPVFYYSERVEPFFNALLLFNKNQLNVFMYMKHLTDTSRENTEILDYVFYKSAFPIIVSDASGNITKYSQSFKTAFPNHTMRLENFIDQGDLESIMAGVAVERDTLNDNRHYHLRAFPSYNSQGHIQGCTVTFVDETIQQLLYKKLERSEERYRTLIKKLPVGLVILGKNGTLYFVNDNFLLSLGLSEPSKVQGNNLQDYFDIDDRSLSSITMEIERKEFHFSKLYARRDFGEKSFSVNFRKILLSDEEYIEAVFQDVSIENSLYAKLSEKNKVLEEEMQTARMVQEHILAVPTIYTAGIRFSTYYKPSLQLGGDFFDIIPIDDIHLAVIIADVSGHGVSASLISSMLKILVEFAPKDPHILGEMMNYLNTGLYKIIPEDHFITMFYGIINTQNYTMEYINCGHPFPLIFDIKTKQVNFLKEVSFPLGSLKNISFDEYVTKTQLPANCMMFLYTDGVMNFKKENQPLSLDELQKFFLEAYSEARGDLLNKLYLNIMKNTIQFSEDDVTMLLISINKDLAYKKFLSVPSNILEIDLAIMKIVTEITKTLHFGDEDRWRVYTALYEAMINAVEHGNKFNVQKRISVIYRIYRNWVIFKVRDQGRGFRVNSIPNPIDEENVLKPSGRGVYMINKIMDKVKHNKAGNEISMFIKIMGL